MRFFVLTSLFASLAFSQSLMDLTAEVPSCAISCLITALSDEDCPITGLECACQNLNSIAESVQPCLREANCALQVSELEEAASKHCQDVVSVTPSSAPPSPTSTDDENETVQTNAATAAAHQGKMLAGVVAIMAAAMI